ncbi:hypothetical protein D9611_014063 [Ephemerocybe angulata]|uniref:Uncharacterized protein n=1 Tax=Ephemerocybe angulata TaxID=980116 RepID=A0A8H5ARR3_9AGAR|nr:hypothetical protein D9611_014063 [Tulosesus angulatus]
MSASLLSLISRRPLDRLSTAFFSITPRSCRASRPLSAPFGACLGPSVPTNPPPSVHYSTRHEAASNIEEYACMAEKRAPRSQKSANKHAKSRVALGGGSRA